MSGVQILVFGYYWLVELVVFVIDWVTSISSKIKYCVSWTVSETFTCNLMTYVSPSIDGIFYGSGTRYGRLQNHPSGPLGEWATQRSTEQMLDGQHLKVEIPAHARTANNSLLQKRLEEDLCWIVPHVPLTTHSVKGLNWTKLNCFSLTPLFAVNWAGYSKNQSISAVGILISLRLQWQYFRQSFFVFFSPAGSTIEILALDFRLCSEKAGGVSGNTQSCGQVFHVIEDGSDVSGFPIDVTSNNDDGYLGLRRFHTSKSNEVTLKLDSVKLEDDQHNFSVWFYVKPSQGKCC